MSGICIYCMYCMYRCRCTSGTCATHIMYMCTHVHDVCSTHVHDVCSTHVHDEYSTHVHDVHRTHVHDVYSTLVHDVTEYSTMCMHTDTGEGSIPHSAHSV